MIARSHTAARRCAPILLAALLLLVACEGDSSDGGVLSIKAVSTRAEYVTSGDVLVAVTGADAQADGLETAVNGEETAVSWRASGDRLLGLVSGLDLGPNEVTVSLDGDDASLNVTNHSSKGPLFSGPHLPLVACTAEGYGLGTPDEDCSVETPVVAWSYVNDEGQRVPLEAGSPIPDDVRTLPDGATPFVLREERGTVNRAVYWLTALDPNPDWDAPARWDPSAWNGRLIYEFGGGCGVTYTQGLTFLPQPDLDLLAEGYAHATSTFNTLQVMCNNTLSAETALMVKERFSEAFGPPELTIGLGGSGGAIQQYLIAQNYPGILDAAAAIIGFPDAVSVSADVLDCVLLGRYASEADDLSVTWTDDERRAVMGHLDAETCSYWERTFATNVDPVAGCNTSLQLLNAAARLGGLPYEGQLAVDEDLIYDAESNPDGLRCTLQDSNVNILGADPVTGFARRTWDNTGVQYGLATLNAGEISPEQFLDLNESIGGFDLDGGWIPGRVSISDDTMRKAYEAGLLNQGAGDLRRIPIISVNVWTDHMGDIHTRDRIFAVRERLRLADGTNSPNHMIWTRSLPEGKTLIDSLRGAIDIGVELIATLDQWATAVAAEFPDRDEAPDRDLYDALERARPDAAVDNCLTTEGERISGLDIYERPGPCSDDFPISSTPRRVAGDSVSRSTMKCQLQPVADAIASGLYEMQWTAEQIERLGAVFPDGVCDYTKPPAGFAEIAGTWQFHGD